MNQFQSFDEVLSALKRRAWVIFLITAIGCLASLNYALSQIKIFEATAVVQIEDSRVPDQLAGATAQRTDAARRVRLIEQRLMSRDNLIGFMDKHDLFTDDPMMTINERVFRMREAAQIQEIVNQANAFATGGNAPSGLLITVRMADPVKTADVANDLMYSVIDQSRTLSVGRARDTLDFFVSEETRVSAAIEELESEISAFKQTNSDRLPTGLADLRDQLASLRDADLDLDREIVIMQTSSARQREEVLERQVALMEEQKALIADRISAIETQIAAAPEVERELNILERRLTQLQEQYSVITRRKSEAELGQLLEDREQTDRFEVLETALEPEFPVSRSRKKTAIMGGIASVIAGIAVAFVMELMNPAIRSAAQMERALGIQPVVSIPAITTRQDRTRSGLHILGFVIGGLATAYALFKLLGAKVPWTDLIGRILPRAVQG